MCLKESMVPFGDESQKAVKLLQNYYYYCYFQNSYKKVLQTITRSNFKSYDRSFL
jgi:hypothetical protein